MTTNTPLRPHNRCPICGKRSGFRTAGIYTYHTCHSCSAIQNLGNWVNDGFKTIALDAYRGTHGVDLPKDPHEFDAAKQNLYVDLDTALRNHWRFVDTLVKGLQS